jgi:hypothetical protein
MPPLRYLFAVLLACAAMPGSATTRCEAADKTISYVQGSCPPGSTAMRRVDAAVSPAPEDQHKAIQQASQRYKDAERLRLAREKQETKQLNADIAASKRAQSNAQQCKRLAVRLKRAKEDERSVTPKDAEKKRIKRVRLEEDFAMQCKN